MKQCQRCKQVGTWDRTPCPTCRSLYQAKWYKALVPRGVCHWCRTAPATTRDHRVPLSAGGAHAPTNIVFACQPCNSGRR